MRAARERVTARVKELVSARLEAYKDSPPLEGKKLSWADVADDITDETKVKMGEEVPRRLVELGIQPRPRNWKAIIDFLISIDTISKEELEEPEIPFRYANFLLDFLRHDKHSQIIPPPKELSGVFNATDENVDGINHEIELIFDIREHDDIIRLSKTKLTYRTSSESNLIRQKSSEPLRTERSKGWAILTPEDNIFMAMKKELYPTNFYYFTMAVNPKIWSEQSATQLALLRHEYPVEQDPNRRSLEELMEETDNGTVLLCFSKTAPPSPGLSDDLMRNPREKRPDIGEQASNGVVRRPKDRDWSHLLDRVQALRRTGGGGWASASEIDDEKTLGLKFLKAAKNGDADTLLELLSQDAPVNFIDPVDHATALHYVAGYAARPALRVILKSNKCDFLIRDRNGRLPSELAREYGRDRPMARLLLLKETRQARANGIDPSGLYKISARQRTP
jgi:hypothetical protein